jgi:predicted Zn-dependent protease
VVVAPSHTLVAVALLVAPAGPAKEPAKDASPVLQAMKDELAHSLAALRQQPTPPYFLSYEISETQSLGASGAFGVLTRSGQGKRRLLDLDLRVGDYSLDNTHAVRDSMDFGDRYNAVEIPIENDPAAIRAVLWYHTDQKYKRAVEQFTKVKTNVQVKVEQEDRSADFSKEPPEVFTEALVPVRADRAAWEQKVRSYSRAFAAVPSLYDGGVDFSVTGETRWYVNSDGSAIQTSQATYRLMIHAMTKADDGMELPRYESFSAFSPEGLPDDATVQKAVERMIADLAALRVAPIVEPYTGPAILSGRASGVFFHEIFGHRVEGHRQKNVEDSQTFKKKLGEPVLPETFSVHFDPTVTRLGSTDLMGAYRFDNQGVKARRVTVVDKGVLKGFLMSRSPIDGFPSSNGHGRKQAGLAPVSRQSNLIVEVTQPLSRAALKERLLEEVQKAGKPFGLLFDDIQGGFTMTGRTIPNAFNVLPILVYRIHPDGREELVRGVDLIGTPLTAFSRILAGDDQVGFFNGMCGAESGGVPVGAASPDILVGQIEVQKKAQSQERPPVLPAPVGQGQ